MSDKHDPFKIPKKPTEEQCKVVADRYRWIVDNSDDGILIIDNNMIIKYANQASGLFLEARPDDMLGNPLASFLDAESCQVIEDLCESARINQIKLCSTMPIETKGERRRFLEICIGSVTDPSGEITSLHMSDRTELNDTLEELRNRNAFFNKLMDSSTDGIIAADIDGKIIVFNKGAEDMVGYTKEEAMTRLHVSRLYPKGEAQNIMKRLRGDEFGGRGRLMRHRLTGLHKDGTQIPISLSGSIIYNEDGEEIATVGIFTDLRQIREMERELEIKQRELIESDRLASLGKLAAGVAHEINNPLTGILTFAEDLLEDSTEDDPRREDYTVIHHEALRCREIVKGLLDFARQDKIAQQSVNVNQIVMQNFGLVKRLASFQNIDITHDLTDDLPVVMGDPTQLQQVILNLMVNASEAMSQGGELYIATRLTNENMVDVSFSDTGEGISPEIMKNIFEPFFSTKGGKTSGLGLAVSWGIVQQHGGRIDVETALGQGTRFHVLLPAAT